MFFHPMPPSPPAAAIQRRKGLRRCASVSRHSCTHGALVRAATWFTSHQQASLRREPDIYIIFYSIMRYEEYTYTFCIYRIRRDLDLYPLLVAKVRHKLASVAGLNAGPLPNRDDVFNGLLDCGCALEVRLVYIQLLGEFLDSGQCLRRDCGCELAGASKPWKR